MTDNITLTGVVATIPRVITTAEGLAITRVSVGLEKDGSFRYSVN